VYPEVSGLSR